PTQLSLFPQDTVQRPRRTPVLEHAGSQTATARVARNPTARQHDLTPRRAQDSSVEKGTARHRLAPGTRAAAPIIPNSAQAIRTRSGRKTLDEVAAPGDRLTGAAELFSKPHEGRANREIEDLFTNIPRG